MKSKQEVELDQALDEYYEKYGKNYPFVITTLMSTEDIIQDVKKHIASGKPKKEPRLRAGDVY